MNNVQIYTNINDVIARFKNRSVFAYPQQETDVKNICDDIKNNGYNALIKYIEKFEKTEITHNSIKVTKEEIDIAKAKVPQITIDALARAKQNIIDFHIRQLRQDNFSNGNNGKTTGFVFRPVQYVGLYVPGGKAAYPSSVLMCALPAIVAGVQPSNIIMATPSSNINPLTLVAAHICGITNIYKMGGAQAIAAMAYGITTPDNSVLVPKADVIAGPGNIYVTLAKRYVFGSVGIDMLAGPSEILIIADNTANPKFIAADMLAQAEHDELASAVLLTTSSVLAQQTQAELEKQLSSLPKKNIALKALQNYSAIAVLNNLDDCVNLSNILAPEHLEICTLNPQQQLDKITAAGSVFLGNYSPEPLGDYYSGTNHVLPTNATARFFSGLGVDTYLKKISVTNYTKQALLTDADDIITLAETEDLFGHANAIKVRRTE